MSYSKVEDLRNLYLESNKHALAGKKTLDQLSFRKQELKRLLRHHNEELISDRETWLRDDIDYFLEYFSILSLAHISGYISLNDLDEYKGEILLYLEISPLKKYFYRHYPLELPQVLAEVLISGVPFTGQKRRNKKSELIFHQFHSLNQKIENEDVNQFLWFLDGGVNDNFDIEDLRKTLGNTGLCFKIRNQRRNNALRQSVRGFFIYLEFLKDFQLFLKLVPGVLEKSAYWMYHAYWFRKIHRRLSGAIKSFFAGVEQYLRMQSDTNSSIRNWKLAVGYYEEILNDLIYDNQYYQVFDTYMRRWRGKLFQKNVPPFNWPESVHFNNQRKLKR